MWEWETSVVLIQNSSNEVLLVRQNYGHHFFGLPGGKVEPGEAPDEAAIRELFEETGLRTNAVTPLSVHDLVYPGTGGKYQAHVFGCDQVSGDLVTQTPDEISSVGWYDLTDLPSPLTPSARAALNQP